MKSRNTKAEEKQACLLEKFQSTGKLSIADIMKELKCNRMSAYNYIKRLENNGCLLKKETIHNKVYYTLESETETPPDNSTLTFRPMTADILRKYSMVRALQNGPAKKNDFRKHFTVYKNQEICNGDGRIPLDIKLTQFHHLLNQLIAEGEIALNPATQQYFLTGKNIPLQMPLSEDELFTMYYELETISSGTPYYEQLRAVYTRIGAFYGTVDSQSPYYNHYLVYGRRLQGLQRSHCGLQMVTACNYQNKVLQISYRSKKGKQLTIHFATGFILYSIEKDTCYLLGEEYPSPDGSAKKRYTIIDVSTIINAGNTDIEHTIYCSPYYKSVFETMFSISLEPPEKVIVSFERVGNVERKIRYLSAQRKNAEIQIRDDRIVYTDFISGLSDFANYLRQFGRSAEVIEPFSLKIRMRESVDKTLSRYEE